MNGDRLYSVRHTVCVCMHTHGSNYSVHVHLCTTLYMHVHVHVPYLSLFFLVFLLFKISLRSISFSSFSLSSSLVSSFSLLSLLLLSLTSDRRTLLFFAVLSPVSLSLPLSGRTFWIAAIVDFSISSVLFHEHVYICYNGSI